MNTDMNELSCSCMMSDEETRALMQLAEKLCQELRRDILRDVPEGSRKEWALMWRSCCYGDPRFSDQSADWFRHYQNRYQYRDDAVGIRCYRAAAAAPARYLLHCLAAVESARNLRERFDRLGSF